MLDTYVRSGAPVKDNKETVAPSHYKNIVGNKQLIELLPDLLNGKTGFEAYSLGQVFKYLCRYGKKSGTYDLGKASWYLTCLMRYLDTGKIHIDNYKDFEESKQEPKELPKKIQDKVDKEVKERTAFVSENGYTIGKDGYYYPPFRTSKVEDKLIKIATDTIINKKSTS